MKQLTKYILAVLCLHFAGNTALVAQTSKSETGVASFYHDKFEGRKTANGEIFRQDKLTAAHKTLPLGTWVRVTNLSNDSTVIVRINDRMPLWNKRSIDLSEAGAHQLNYIHKGLTKVLIEIIQDPFRKPAYQRPTDLPLEYMDVFGLQQFAESNPQPAIKPSPLYFDPALYASRAMVKKKYR